MTAQVVIAALDYRVHKVQRGTGTCQWANCNCTEHAAFVKRDYLGAVDADPGAIRSWIDTHLGIACSAGTNDIQNEKALAALYPPIELTHRFDVPWASQMDALDAGREIGIIEKYSPWHGTYWDCSVNFNGGHKVRYLRRRWNAATNRFELLRSDPLADGINGPLGPKWAPESIARQAGEAEFSDLNVEAEVTRSFTATAPKQVLYAKDTKTGIVGKIRARPDVSSAAFGSIARGMKLTHSGVVSGTGWTVNGWTGTKWLRVTAIDGTPVTTRFVALGWVTGPTGAY